MTTRRREILRQGAGHYVRRLWNVWRDMRTGPATPAPEITYYRKKVRKEEQRGKLAAHTNRVTSTLGTTINTYPDRIGAGFQIDSQPPN